MLIRVLAEPRPGNARVALVPRGVSALTAAGHRVLFPAGAGTAAGLPDAAYADAGAEVFAGPPPAAELVVAVGPVDLDAVLPTGAVVAFLDPLGRPQELARFAGAGLTTLAMELIPRTTQAQAMDALSSQATAAGYQAVLLAAARLPRFLPMMMTAAGTVPPARVLVVGAGVAGLQAIATARRLGAVVSGYDIRPAAAEQVRSLGATFVGGPIEQAAESAGGYAGQVSEDTRARQMASLAEHVAAADIVITTAQVPGKPAPRLITRAMVGAMKPGSVVIDLAGSSGGNCEATVTDEEVDVEGVLVLGPSDLAAGTAGHASEMYSRNVTALIRHLAPDGSLHLDFNDPITAAACVTHAGEIMTPAVRAALGGAS
ncbi:MAG: NAD(P) transhydrogenase subunit alpha [Acidimicrobiia bacterium]|jgi:NAD(P) transhydrogenase subunit alpha|nr:NAD(P) transhydrogenase subunit alpha [Acidimicrobiia bacterium]